MRQETAQSMDTILDSQTRSIWSSPFIDKGHLFDRVHIFERFPEQKIYKYNMIYACSTWYILAVGQYLLNLIRPNKCRLSCDIFDLRRLLYLTTFPHVNTIRATHLMLSNPVTIVWLHCSDIQPCFGQFLQCKIKYGGHWSVQSRLYVCAGHINCRRVFVCILFDLSSQ